MTVCAYIMWLANSLVEEHNALYAVVLASLPSSSSWRFSSGWEIDQVSCCQSWTGLNGPNSLICRNKFNPCLGIAAKSWIHTFHMGLTMQSLLLGYIMPYAKRILWSMSLKTGPLVQLGKTLRAGCIHLGLLIPEQCVGSHAQMSPTCRAIKQPNSPGLVTEDLICQW